MPENWQEAGFGLYVHWPFCAAKCPYCDFNSHVTAHVDQDRWAAAYEAEVERVARETQGRVLSSVFFGGGTPSLMSEATVLRIMDRIRSSWTVSNDFEVTLEANPTSVEANRFAAYRDAGVNRVSLGVQALNDRDLKRLGRLHSEAEALAALETAQSVFDRVSFDLIYARQDQSAEAWENELRRALGFGMTHLSLYQLTIEDGTAFGDRARAGRLPGLPDEDLSADLYAITQDLTAAADLPAYEISNHCKPGEACRHSLVYWRDGDWAAIGPGGHGRFTVDGRRFATTTHLLPGVWLGAVEERGTGEDCRSPVEANDILTDRLMMGLRLTEGVPISRLAAWQNHHYINNINRLRESGVLRASDRTLAVRPEYRPVLNAVLRQILA